jgi:trehalose 6-phosphate phosphatase
MTPPPGTATAERLLAPLRAEPARAALLCDIDGTLAPIVERPEDAAVPDATQRLLTELARRYGLVACVSGRRAARARAMVGVDSILYIGNHGLEILAPGAEEPVLDAGVGHVIDRVREFTAEHFTPELEQLGVTLEDKEAIWSFHFRRARDEDAVVAALGDVARAARDAGLNPHWGRKVLEIRPTAALDKGTAVAAALEDSGLDHAMFGGDDATDVDAFRRLRALVAEGLLAGAVCVGVSSAETPARVREEADVLVDGTKGFLQVLETLNT